MEDEIIPEEGADQKITTSQWIQDNLRIIISILIVVAIAGGIYSYSNRGEEMMTEEQQVAQEESTETTEATDVTEVTESTPATEVAQVASSQETENSFIETAGRGDGATHLARRALANYLEKNQDSTLTVEHKIYIEDYLRKSVSHTGGVYVGTSIEFSNSLIQDAISKSKTLNESQLTNLHKYAVRVPSLA